MKSVNILYAGLLLVASPVLAAAQSGLAVVDSTNKQLQRGGKPPKTVVTTQALIAQPNGKPKHSAAVPAIVVTTIPKEQPAAARVATDSVRKVAPPVQRAAVTGKKKPPAQ